MSKKLLMNNYFENNDEIVLCENYTPTNIPFYLYKDKIIDWDNYELYISLNLSNGLTNWKSALCVSSDGDIVSWSPIPNAGKIHIYYSAYQIRLQPVITGKSGEYDNSLSKYNKEKIQVIINKNGVFINNANVISNKNDVFKQVFNYLKMSNVTTIGISELGCTYNKISIRKCERG